MHLRTSHRASLAMATVALVAATVSCTDGTIGPSAPSFNVTPPGPTQSKICKYGPVGTYTFTVTSASPLVGTMLVASPVSITVFDGQGACRFIHQSGNGTDVLVIRETPLPVGIVVDNIITGAIGDGCHTNPALCPVQHRGTDQVTISPTATTGFYASFYNVVAPTPPPPTAGTQGCTPGYWRNHLGSWRGFSPSADFDATFGVNAFSPDITLGQAIQLGGGGINQLARHATAALLNASHGGVSFGLSAAEVIGMVQAAVASGQLEQTALLFDTMNNRGCPLN